MGGLCSKSLPLEKKLEVRTPYINKIYIEKWNTYCSHQQPRSLCLKECISRDVFTSTLSAPSESVDQRVRSRRCGVSGVISEELVFLRAFVSLWLRLYLQRTGDCWIVCACRNAWWICMWVWNVCFELEECMKFWLETLFPLCQIKSSTAPGTILQLFPGSGASLHLRISCEMLHQTIKFPRSFSLTSLYPLSPLSVEFLETIIGWFLPVWPQQIFNVLFIYLLKPNSSCKLTSLWVTSGTSAAKSLKLCTHSRHCLRHTLFIVVLVTSPIFTPFQGFLNNFFNLNKKMCHSVTKIRNVIYKIFMMSVTGVNNIQ